MRQKYFNDDNQEVGTPNRPTTPEMKQWESETWHTWRFAYINKYISKDEELDILGIQHDKGKKEITLTYLRTPKTFSNL